MTSHRCLNLNLVWLNSAHFPALQVAKIHVRNTQKKIYQTLLFGHMTNDTNVCLSILLKGKVSQNYAEMAKN